MTMSVEAIFENGVLKPKEPLSLAEHETVLLTVHTGTTWAERTAGIMGFRGTIEEADYFAMDPELAFPPPPEGE
jgi:predicted DNA-binding antitoxin AbrB/MazE fold protein